MTVTIYDTLEQGSPEWLQARCGILTASVIGKLITPTLKVADNDTARNIIATLAAERITGDVDYVHPTFDMLRGHDDEPVARALYAEHFHDVAEVGFIIREEPTYRLGYSPDGVVGDHGLLEIKSRRPKVHVQTVLADRPPAENVAQLQAGLFVTGRKWIDYCSYSPGLPMWVQRVYPDPAWQTVIEQAATVFEEHVNHMVDTFNTATAGMPPTEPRVDLEEIRI